MAVLSKFMPSRSQAECLDLEYVNHYDIESKITTHRSIWKGATHCNQNKNCRAKVFVLSKETPILWIIPSFDYHKRK
jgi:hypothetical protein